MGLRRIGRGVLLCVVVATGQLSGCGGLHTYLERARVPLSALDAEKIVPMLRSVSGHTEDRKLVSMGYETWGGLGDAYRWEAEAYLTDRDNPDTGVFVIFEKQPDGEWKITEVGHTYRGVWIDEKMNLEVADAILETVRSAPGVKRG